jgi:hypothetical protein
MAQTAEASIVEEALGRPAVLECTALLKITDSQLARLFGLTPSAVCAWANRREQIPLIRQLALIYLVSRLAGLFDQVDADSSIHARRAHLFRQTLDAWLNIAAEELGPVRPSPELRHAADCMAYRLLAALGVKRRPPDVVAEVVAEVADEVAADAAAELGTDGPTRDHPELTTDAYGMGEAPGVKRVPPEIA